VVFRNCRGSGAIVSIRAPNVLQNAAWHWGDSHRIDEKQARPEECPGVSSLCRFVEFLHPGFAFEDFAGTRAVGWPDDAVFLHDVD